MGCIEFENDHRVTRRVLAPRAQEADATPAQIPRKRKKSIPFISRRSSKYEITDVRMISDE